MTDPIVPDGLLIALSIKPPIFFQSSASGRIASAPASPPTIALLPFIPKRVGSVIIPPSLYHSTPNLGIFGGGPRLNSPVTEKCGIFSFGSSQWKLKKPLMLSIAPETIDFAPSIILWNLLFIPSKTVPTAACASDIFVDIALLISSSFPPVKLFIKVNPAL